MQAKVVDLDNLRVEVEKMRSNMQQLEGAKSWLERSLKETEVSFTMWSSLPVVVFIINRNQNFFLNVQHDVVITHYIYICIYYEKTREVQ